MSGQNYANHSNVEDIPGGLSTYMPSIPAIIAHIAISHFAQQYPAVIVSHLAKISFWPCDITNDAFSSAR